jgi:hypothetical protein
MVILRPTSKLRSFLPTVDVSARSDTALGDWYVNRIVVARQRASNRLAMSGILIELRG